MPKVTVEYEAKYEKDDVVIYDNGEVLMVGIVEGYYFDDEEYWYDVRINKDEVVSHSYKGEVAECNVLGKVEPQFAELCREKICKNRKWVELVL